MRFSVHAEDIQCHCEDNCMVTRLISTAQVLDCSSPPEDSSPMSPNGRSQVSTFCARHDLVAAGGFGGELDVINIHRPGILCRWLCSPSCLSAQI